MRTPGNNTTLLFLLALLTALIVAGCGGGGDETETTTPTVEEPTALTKDELIEQGDGICAEVNAAVGALGSSESEEASDSGEKIANLYIGMVERLQDLGAPEGDDGSYAKFMEAAEELAKVEGEMKVATEEEDVAAMEAAGQEASAALEEFQSQAAIYGFEDCSEEPGELPIPTEPGSTPGGEEFEGGEEGGIEVEPELEEPAPEEEFIPEEEEEFIPETGGAGGGSEAPEPAPETGGESGGVGPG